MFMSVLGESIIGRAIKNKLIELNVVNIRDFSADKHRKTDDYPYGGGTGLVMTPQPIYDAWLSVAGGHAGEPCGNHSGGPDIDPCGEAGSLPLPSQAQRQGQGQAQEQGLAPARTIYLSPQGATLTQKKALELAREKRLILLCGHYEGIDERALEIVADEEISIGDYVLTGGELPAMALIDCVARLIPGVLPSEDAYTSESHFDGLLEFPQYTRPYSFMGRMVPDVLLSGHHRNIEEWRRAQSLERTRRKRPDLLP
jgi:tRNA (guanine37-N1)-methyltransferase